jgi:hypothetical protein
MSKSPHGIGRVNQSLGTSRERFERMLVHAA